MKKCLVFISFIFLSSQLLSQELYIKAGMDIPGKLLLHSELKNIDFTTKTDIETHLFYGFHFGLEYLHYFQKKIGIGAGFCYESEIRANSDDLETFGFNTMPWYLIFKYDFLMRKSFKLSLFNRLGYSDVNITSDKMEEFDDHSGDFYYGFGLAVKELQNSKFYLEICYSVSQANFSKIEGLKSVDHQYDYPKYSLTVGRIFNFSRDKK